MYRKSLKFFIFINDKPYSLKYNAALLRILNKITIESAAIFKKKLYIIEKKLSKHIITVDVPTIILIILCFAEYLSTNNPLMIPA